MVPMEHDAGREDERADRRGPHGLRLLTRDPTLVVLSFSVWSLLTGLSLIGPGNVLQAGPYYQQLVGIGWPEEVWGAIMLFDALLLARTALFDGTVARAATAAVSGAFWLFFGSHVLAGGFEAGVLSAVGAWEVCAGLALLGAVVQWAGHGEGADAE